MGDTVVFTSTTANTDVANLANTGTGTVVVTTTAGSAATAAKTGVLGVVNGTVLVDDNATASITTVSVDGYGDASKIGNTTSLTKLATLTLANSGGTLAGDTDADMTVDAAGVAAGTLTAAEVETVNVTSTDTTTPFNAVHTLTLTADKATAVTVTGNAVLTLTMTGSTKVASIDGSAMTGALTVTSLNTTSATTIKGGSGNDVLIAAVGTTADVLIGGAGNDILVANAGLTTMTGGAGADVFRISTASLNVNSYATITDFAAGDLLQIDGAVSFASAKVTLGDTAVFQDYANAAINALGANAAGWFQFGGNTYVLADIGVNETTFNNGQDFIVKLTGLVDLTNASFNSTYDTIAL